MVHQENRPSVTTTGDLPRRTSPRGVGKPNFEKPTKVVKRKQSKKEQRTRNYTIKQPGNQNSNLKRNGSGRNASGNSAESLSSGGRRRLTDTNNCIYYHQVCDELPSVKAKRKDPTGIRTTRFSYVLTNGTVCSGVIRTSNSNSRGGNGRKQNGKQLPRFDMDIDDDGYYDDFNEKDENAAC